MTCIVGLLHNGVVYIGGDSLGSNGYSKVVRRDPKVFKLKDSDKALIGYTSSFRMGQLLMYKRDLLDIRVDSINHEYMVTKFIPSVISTFEDGGFGELKNGEKSGGSFLVGYDDKLYEIDNDYQVAELSSDYTSVGSGQSFALGSLHTTNDSELSPIERIHIALQSAAQFSTSVAGPFHIMNTHDNTIVTFDK